MSWTGFTQRRDDKDTNVTQGNINPPNLASPGGDFTAGGASNGQSPKQNTGNGQWAGINEYLGINKPQAEAMVDKYQPMEGLQSGLVNTVDKYYNDVVRKGRYGTETPNISGYEAQINALSNIIGVPGTEKYKNALSRGISSNVGTAGTGALDRALLGQSSNFYTTTRPIVDIQNSYDKIKAITDYKNQNKRNVNPITVGQSETIDVSPGTQSGQQNNVEDIINEIKNRYGYRF